MLPACRHKYYEELVFSCELIGEYLIVKKHKNDLTKRQTVACYKQHRRRAQVLESELKPTKWKLGEPRMAGLGWSIYLTKEASMNKVHWGSTYF